MKYAISGKRSKAWWLHAVKWFGPDGTKGIMRGAEVPTYQVREAIEDLAGVGMVRVEGKTGKGYRPKYHLTEIGSRYLADHETELEEKTIETKTPNGAAQTGVNHTVPSTPGDRPIRSIIPEHLQPERPAAETPEKPPTPVTPASPDILRHGNSGLKTPLNTPTNSEKPSFRDAFKEVLFEILMEKYGADISAAEVMERLEAQE